jgi:transcriptional regulator with XRE-family HTH domain
MGDTTHDSRYQSLLEALVFLRKSAGLTQADLAQRLRRPQSYISKIENGERRIDALEMVDLAQAFDADPQDLVRAMLGRDVLRHPEGKRNILDQWSLTVSQLTELVEQNPSMRGILLGYIAEMKLTEIWFSDDRIRYITKSDDHDRVNKGDHLIEYRGHQFVVESKSLQSHSVRIEGRAMHGKAQVDASDRRTISLSSGQQVNTTLLRYGEFDLLAVNCFAFNEGWRFVFARNRDLPCSRYRKYPQSVRSELIASLVEVTWPPEPPFFDQPYDPLNRIIAERKLS